MTPPVFSIVSKLMNIYTLSFIVKSELSLSKVAHYPGKQLNLSF